VSERTAGRKLSKVTNKVIKKKYMYYGAKRKRNS
jgi:hypothetical protein